MARSTKRGPRMDDALKHETDALVRGAPVEGHAREDRQQETMIDGEPSADLRGRPDIEEAPGIGVSTSTADERAELAAAIAQAEFPARRDALVPVAEAAFASATVLGRLRSLPAEREFGNVQEVWAAAGGEVEGSHT